PGALALLGLAAYADEAPAVTTSHSTLLYATETASEDGEIETLASHKVASAGARFTWKIDDLPAGDYLVFVQYALDSGSVRVDVGAGRSDLSARLYVTPRVYPATGEWYQRSFAREQLPGILEVPRGSTGEAELSLRIAPTSSGNPVALRALELLPSAATGDADAEIMRAGAARPDTGWFAELGYGLMFHWTSQAAPRSGPVADYAAAVDAFDVSRFVGMVASTGADYVIFTTNHAEPHFPAPLAGWEKTHPGRTTERDLIRELADGLSDHGIVLMLYFATHIYADLENAGKEQFVDANVRLLTEVGERYGDDVAGYWLDGWYQAAEKYGDLPYERVYRAAKSGNPDRLLALNSWIYPLVSPWQDYWAGEVYSVPVAPSARIVESGPGAGLQYHALLALEGGWVHTERDTAIPAPVLETGDLLAFIDAASGKGPVTLNVLVYQDGSIGDASMRVLETIREHRDRME
ncbi:MAG TPA: alpha-L-fucosidase, partial [Woeseiaceae bacterium]|nr:alpha-L-fucosidase [Woeseiaceae bacterium]